MPIPTSISPSKFFTCRISSYYNKDIVSFARRKYLKGEILYLWGSIRLSRNFASLVVSVSYYTDRNNVFLELRPTSPEFRSRTSGQV